MSQIYKLATAGSLPPTVVETFTADDLTVATAAAHNINNRSAVSVITNNVNGIQTTNLVDTIKTQLTNRIQGTVTTTDATVTPIVNFSLGATPATYIFTTKLVAINKTTGVPATYLSAGYDLIEVVRTTGAAGVDIAPPDIYIVEEGAMSGVAIVSGVSGNNYLITVAGYDTQTIDWVSLTTYTMVT